MHLALRSLLVVGVDDVLTVNVAHDYRAGRSVERNVGNRQRDGRANHAEHLGRNVGVDG